MRRNREQRAALRAMRRYVRGAVLGILFSAAALLSIPFLDPSYSEELRTPYLITGLVFWIGIVLEIQCYVMAAYYKKRYIRAADPGDRNRARQLVGICCFFQNHEAMIADIALILAVLWLLLAVVLRWNGTWQVVSPVVSFFLALQFHSMLNGRIYAMLRAYRIEKKGDGKHENNA